MFNGPWWPCATGAGTVQVTARAERGTKVTNVIDGVEKPQEGRRWKHFDYSGKMLLIMTDFEKKVQCKIAQVKGSKGENKLGWVKFPVKTEDKFYLDDPITELWIFFLRRHENFMNPILD